jgi:hypothetical protein
MVARYCSLFAAGIRQEPFCEYSSCLPVQTEAGDAFSFPFRHSDDLKRKWPVGMNAVQNQYSPSPGTGVVKHINRLITRNTPVRSTLI